jgi:hypothetical protein
METGRKMQSAYRQRRVLLPLIPLLIVAEISVAQLAHIRAAPQHLSHGNLEKADCGARLGLRDAASRPMTVTSAQTKIALLVECERFTK